MKMTFANKITIFRILSTPLFITALIYYTPEKEYLRLVALGIFILAILSDAVDGYIARTQGQKTRAGAILDPLADKILLISAFLMLYFVSQRYFDIQLPLWVMLIVVFRDIILLLCGGIITITHQEIEVQPTWWGKTSTFFQMITILALLLKFQFSSYCWNLAIIFTLVSGIDYLRKGIVILNQQTSKK